MVDATKSHPKNPPIIKPRPRRPISYTIAIDSPKLRDPKKFV